MNISISKKSLLDALNIVKLGIASNPILPILEEVKVSFSDGQLQLQATDNNIGITLNVNEEVTIEGEGAFTFCQKVISLIPTLKDGIIDILISENSIVLKQGKNKYTFPSSDPNDFPLIINEFGIPDGSLLSIEYYNFKQTLIDSLDFCSTNESQVALCGIFLEMRDQYMLVTATNAHLLSTSKIESPTINNQEIDVIIPSSFAKVLKSIKRNPEFCNIIMGEKNICVVLDGVSISCRIVDENYPDYRKVIPSTNVGHLSFPSSSFLDSVKRLKILADKSTVGAAFVYNKCGVAMCCKDSDFDIDGLEIMNDGVDSDMGKGFIGFNLKNILTAISSLKDDQIKFLFSGNSPSNAVIIEEDSASVSRRILMMPLLLDHSNYDSIYELLK